MKKKIYELKKVGLTAILIVMNKMAVYATAPNRSNVETIAIEGIEMFFGALGGIAVIFGGIEFVQAFLSYRENEEEGGSGEANAKVGKKILAGVLCLVGAVLVFTIMNWTKTLFNLD